MAGAVAEMDRRKRIALVAHDNKKDDLLEWARYNRDSLAHHELCSTGTTGRLLEHELGVQVTKLMSGPLGGDQQLGAMIAQGVVDLLVFFWDPLEPQPHDPDVKALLRIAVVWNIPIACPRASADFMFSSSLLSEAYPRQLPDYGYHVTRRVGHRARWARHWRLREADRAPTAFPWRTMSVSPACREVATLRE